jgi:hypothetical protein
MYSVADPEYIDPVRYAQESLVQALSRNGDAT